MGWAGATSLPTERPKGPRTSQAQQPTPGAGSSSSFSSDSVPLFSPGSRARLWPGFPALGPLPEHKPGRVRAGSSVPPPLHEVHSPLALGLLLASSRQPSLLADNLLSGFGILVLKYCVKVGFVWRAQFGAHPKMCHP